MREEFLLEAFEECARNKKLHTQIIQKDYWVCYVLKSIFEDDFLGDKFVFKGGTSLSKVFGIIKRFSEDIDLVLNPKYIGFEGGFPLEDILSYSNNQRNFRAEKIGNKGLKYIQEELYPHIKSILEKQGFSLKDCKQERNRALLEIAYPKLFNQSNGYAKNEILLEISILSPYAPLGNYPIQSYICELEDYQALGISTQVEAISAEKTFWDKISILHQEAHRPNDKVFPQRYSRHYYDVIMIFRELRKNLIEDIKLCRDTFRFKQCFYYVRWANFEKMIEENQICLIPSETHLKTLKEDFEVMRREFLFECDFDFSGMIEELEKIEKAINFELKEKAK